MSEPKTSQYPVTILERHLDTFGHVNNAVYLEIYEEARWNIINAEGYDLNYIKKSGQGPVLLDVYLKFLKELRLHQKITVKTQVQSYEGKISKLKQWMEDEGGGICSEAVFTVALFDLKERKLILPTPQWLKALGMEGN
jgi:thioesterase-3